MKILHVIPSLNPADGGPPVVAVSLAAGQASLGHDVQLVTYSGGNQLYADDALLRDVPGGYHVRLITLNPPTAAERFFARGAKAKLRSLIGEGVEAVHLHNVWEAILPVAAAEARRARVPYVLLANGMLDPWSLSQSPLKKKIALATGYRTMLACAAALHILNADEQRLIAPLGLPTTTRIIPNGIFEQQVVPLPDRGTFRGQRPELGDRPFVLFLSRLHYKKGLDFLAEAFAIIAATMPEVQLVVAGPDGGERAPFIERIAKAGLTDRVHLVGPLYGAAKLAACVDATCFCLPSRQEGFSMAIVEAMACGCPVVISEGCHFPEVVTEEAGVVVPLTADAVAAGLNRVLENPAEAARLGARGRNLILERYTWPRIAEQSIAVYREATHSRPA